MIGEKEFFSNYRITSDGKIMSNLTGRPLKAAKRRRELHYSVRLNYLGKTLYINVAEEVLREFGHIHKPKGAKAWFADGNPENCHIDNLYWAFGESFIDISQLIDICLGEGSISEKCRRHNLTERTVRYQKKKNSEIIEKYFCKIQAQ